MLAFFSRSPSPFSILRSLRCNHPLSLSLALADTFQQPLAVLPLFYDGRYSTLLPLSDDYLCLWAKREMKAKLFDSAPTFRSRYLSPPLAFFRLSLSFFLRLPSSLAISSSVSLYSLLLRFSLLFSLLLSSILSLHSPAPFRSLAYTLVPPFLPTAPRLPSSFHPSNFSTPFTKIKINSSTTCPGTMPETLLPSSTAVYHRLQKAYIPRLALYIDVSSFLKQIYFF